MVIGSRPLFGYLACRCARLWLPFSRPEDGIPQPRKDGMIGKAAFILLAMGLSAAALQQLPADTSRPAGHAAVSPQATTGDSASPRPASPAEESKSRETLGSQASSDQIRIGTGDLVEVGVFGVPDLKQKTRVDSAGKISLPLIGLVPVAGLTSEEAERGIEKLLVDGGFLRHPQVSVFVVEYATQGASVLGEVARPGVYPVLGARRLFDVISAAGGYTDKAGRTITITHRDQPTAPQVVDVSRDPAKSLEANVEIRPGDTILVSRAGVIFVVGDVARPGGFTIDKNDRLTVLQAIALAEGTKGTASLDKAKLIRRTAVGPQEVPIPLKKILEGKSPDLALQAEDIVFVPGSLTKSAGKRTAEAVIQTLVGIAIYRP